MGRDSRPGKNCTCVICGNVQDKEATKENGNKCFECGEDI